eukprot:gene9177-16310_t
MVPFVVSAKCKWSMHDGHYSFKYSCRDTIMNGKLNLDLDTIINGKLNLDLGQQSVSYRKPFPLPLVGTRFGTFVARLAWNYTEGLNQKALSYKLGFEISQGGGAFVAPNAVRFKPNLYYKNFGIQALSYKLGFEISQEGGGFFIAPNAVRFKPNLYYRNFWIQLLFEMSGNTADRKKQFRLADAGENGQPEPEKLGIDIDVQELNLVLRL